MPLYYGTHPITALHYGTHPITHLYKGSTLIWTPGGIRDMFDVDGPLNPTYWTDDGAGYDIGVENGLCRILLPDFLSIAGQTTRARYTAEQHAADGHVEIKVGNPGSGNNLATDIFRRASNTSGNAAGVGIRLQDSELSILRRVGSTDTPMASCGAFQGGDIVRLVQIGNVHSMYRNGKLAGEWNDVGSTALNTSAERTLTMVHRGIKQVWGPRRFSPSIDSIECV